MRCSSKAAGSRSVTEVAETANACGSEMAKLRESVQELALQVARLSEAVSLLGPLREQVSQVRDRVLVLEGFRSAVFWIAGVLGTGAALRTVLLFWFGGR